MFRSLTSDVSALSSGVAKGQQTVPTFLLPPLKFRTAGFPQYGFKLERLWRPSSNQFGLSLLPAYAKHPWTYTPTLADDGQFCSPCGHLRRTPFHRFFQSRGPWLDSGLCCPAVSLLTMASSESLVSSQRLMHSSLGLCSTGASEREARASPIYSARLYHRAVFRTPVNRTPAFGCCFGVRTSLRLLRRGSAFTSPRRRFSRGRFTRLQSSLDAAARWLACPSPTRAFTFELAAEPSPTQPSSITTRAYNQFPRPDFHRLDAQPYGLRTKKRRGRRFIPYFLRILRLFVVKTFS